MLEKEQIESLEQGLAKGFPQNLQMGFETLDLGYVRMKMPVEDRLLNIYGMVHGGVLYTLLDTTSGFAVRTYGERVVTLNGSVNYLRAGKNTKKLVCEARVVKKGKGCAVVSAEVFDDGGELLANGSFTFYILNQTGEEKWREKN